MADFRTRLQLDGSDFNSALNDAEKSVNDFAKQTQDASKQVDGLGKSTKKTASELLNEMKSMEGLGRSTSNYRSQLAQMTRQIQDLTVNYRAMSDEMKNSDFGREVAAQIQELTQKASQMKDTVQDASASVKLLASDTANLDAAKMGIEGLSSAFSLVASAGLLGADSTEKLVKVMARLKAIESATNAVIKIANILNKDSILMLKIKNLQTNLATKATVTYTTTTKGATVAQRAFNTVAKANPYVLLATAILTVVGALAAFESSCGDAEDAQDDLNKELKEGIDLNKTYKDSFNNTFVPLLTTFKKLQIGWKDLKTDLEKTEFIKNNAEEFKKLGVEVNGVKEAEDILVNNSELFLKTLDLRAQAAAAAAVAMEAYKEAMNIDMKGFDKLPKAGDLVPAGVSNPRRYGLAWDHMEADGMHHDYKFTQEGADQYIIENRLATAYVNKQKAINKANEALQKEVDIQKQLQSIMPNTGGSGGSGSGGSSGPDYEQGSLAWYDAQIQELQNVIKNERLSQQELENINAKINQLEADKLAYVQSLRGGPLEMIPQLNMVGTQKAIEDLQKYYEEHPLQIKGEVTPDGEEYTLHDSFSAANDVLGSIKSINSGIDGIYSRWSKFAENVEDKNPFEIMLYSIDSLISTMQTIVSIMDTINGLQELFNSLGWIGVGAKEAEVAAETAGLGPKAASVELSEQEAVANAAAAAGAVGESAGKIPYVGWILAIAAVAGIIAAIASAKSSIGFAKGGIVPGSSFSGDNISAQLNSGEMVLTTQQQTRLFNLLNGEGSLNGSSNKVEFVIKGQELKGVLNNYDKKMSRI